MNNTLNSPKVRSSNGPGWSRILRPAPVGLVLVCLLTAAMLWYSLAEHAWYLWIACAAIGLISLTAGASRRDSSRAERAAVVLICLAIFLILLQIVPLPVPVLAVLSPTRAALARAVDAAPGNWAPSLSVAPAVGWEQWLRVSALAIVLFAVAAFQRRLRGWIVIMPVLLVALVECLVALLQYFSNPANERAHGSLVNPDHFSAFLEMVLPFAAMFAVLHVARRRTAMPGARLWHTVKAAAGLTLCGLLLLGIAFAFSRVGLAAAGAGLGICGLLLLPRAWSMPKRTGVASVLIVVIVAAIIGFAPSRLISRMNWAADTPGTLTDRLRIGMWQDTLHLIAAYPLFGCGAGAYGSALLKYQTADLEHSVIYSHNDYLQVTAESGVLGLALGLSLAILVGYLAVRAAYRGSHRQDRFLAMACAGALTAIAIHSLFDFNLYIVPVAMTVAWVCGVVLGLGNAPDSMRRVVLALSLVVLVYSALGASLFPKTGKDLALEQRTCRIGFCANESVAAAAYEKVKNPAQLKSAEADLALLLRREPYSPFRWLDLGQIQAATGDRKAGEFSLSMARQSAPHHPVVLTRLAGLEAQLGQRKEALADGSQVLADVATFDNVVFQLQKQIGATASEVTGSGVFPGCRAARVYFVNLLAARNAAEAPQAWSWLTANHCADDAAASGFTDLLLSQAKAAEASKVWNNYQGVAGGNLLYNGNFAKQPSGSRFDWRLNDPGHSVLTPDDGLKLMYRGDSDPPEDLAVHAVYLMPGNYKISAKVKTENFPPEQFIALRILKLTTAGSTGTTDWHTVEQKFTFPGPARLVEVKIVRQIRGFAEANPVGNVWIKDIQLVRQ